MFKEESKRVSRKLRVEGSVGGHGRSEVGQFWVVGIWCSHGGVGVIAEDVRGGGGGGGGRGSFRRCTTGKGRVDMSGVS